MKKISFILLVISTLAINNVLAQKLSTSPFSRYGVGEMFFQGDVKQMSMGNTAIADFNSYHLSAVNPANVSALKANSVLFEVGLFHKLSAFDNGTSLQINNTSNFSHILGGFRVARFWHTGFGLLPYSGVGYKVQVSDSLAIDNSISLITNNYEGTGGINRLFWTNSLTLFNHLYLGAKINYNFGNLSRQSTTVISDSVYMSIAVIADRNFFHKFSYDFGFTFADTIFNKDEQQVFRYSIGGIFANQYSMSSIEQKFGIRSVSVYNRSFSDSIFYDTVGTSTIMMPQTFGGGLSMTYKNSLTFNFDYIISKWANSSILGETNFADSRFIGTGLEYCIAPLSTRYYKTIRYRLGAYQYDSYMIFNNQQLKTQAITFGFGFPVKAIQLNLGFVIGRTGSIDLGLQENFYQFNLGVSLYDIWFVKRKFM